MMPQFLNKVPLNKALFNTTSSNYNKLNVASSPSAAPPPPAAPISGPKPPNLAYNPNDPLSVNVSGPSVELGSRQERTNIVKDPWQDFLYNTILKGSGSQDAFVPGYTKAALENFTRNPAMAAQYFPQLAEPLLEANRVSQQRQTQNTMDMFRKAGGAAAGTLQSGAFAQAGRQLAGDFARQDQELLAKAYTPLTAQLSENMTNAINAGLKFPQANNVALQNLIPLATSVRPLQTDTETLTGGTSAGAIPSAPNMPSWLTQPAIMQNPGSWNQHY